MTNERHNRNLVTEVLIRIENLLVASSQLEKQELNLDKKIIDDLKKHTMSIYNAQPVQQVEILKALNMKIIALREELFEAKDKEIYLIDKKNKSVVVFLDKLLTCVNDGLLQLRKNTKDKKNLSVKFKEANINPQRTEYSAPTSVQADLPKLNAFENIRMSREKTNLDNSVTLSRTLAKQNQDNNLKAAASIASALHDIAGKDLIVNFSSVGSESQPDPSISIKYDERLNKTELKALIKTLEARTYSIQSKKNALILRPSSEQGYFSNFDTKSFKFNYLSHLKHESNAEQFLEGVKDILERLNLTARDAMRADIGIVIHEGKLKIAIILSIKQEAEHTTLKNLYAALEKSKLLTTAKTENNFAIVPNQSGAFDSMIDIPKVIKNYNIASFEATRATYNSKAAASGALWPSINPMNPADPTPSETSLKPPMSKAIDGLKKIASQELYRLIVDGRFHAEEQGWMGYASREMNSLPAVFNAMKVAFSDLNDKAVTLELIKKIHATACHNVTGIGEYAASHPDQFRKKHSGFKLDISFMNEDGFYELYDFVKQNEDKGCLLSVVNNSYLDNLSSSEDLNTRFNQLTPSSLSKKELWDIIVNEKNDSTGNHKIVCYRAPHAEHVEKFMSAACDHYNNRIHTATTTDDKIKLMAQLAKLSEWIHSFTDVNGRTNTVLLQRLLIQENSLPTMLFNPNYIDGYSLNSLVEEIKRGIKMTLQSIEKPNEPIYGYRTKILRCYSAPETREGKIFQDYNNAVASLHTHIQSINTFSTIPPRPHRF